MDFQNIPQKALNKMNFQNIPHKALDIVNFQNIPYEALDEMDLLSKIDLRKALGKMDLFPKYTSKSTG